MIRRSRRRRARVEAAVAAYVRWRAECEAVHAAYRAWKAASASGEPLAFGAYQAALDGEERAAKRYAGLMGRVGQLPGTGRAHQLAHIDSVSGAW